MSTRYLDFIHRGGRLLTAFGLASLVSECMPLPSPVTMKDLNSSSADATFQGLNETLDETKELRVLIVHGMASHDTGYSARLQTEIADAMRLKPERPSLLIPLPGKPAVLTKLLACTKLRPWKDAFGDSTSLRRCSYQRANDPTTRVIFYELTWSRLTHDTSTKRLSYDWNGDVAQRAVVNRLIKKGLVDQAFSDAIMYAGTFAPVLRRAVADALCASVSDGNTTSDGDPCAFDSSPLYRSPASARVVLLSHSLGSAIVIETIAEMLKPTCSADEAGSDCVPRADSLKAADFLHRLSLIGLLANQLPLFALARVDTAPGPRHEVIPSLATLQAAIGTDDRHDNTLTTVAISDPNDLLSFPLDSTWLDTARGRQVVNVSLPNATWIGAAANPATAHTGYLDNACVARLLANGRPQCWWAGIWGAEFGSAAGIHGDLGLLIHAYHPFAVPLTILLGPRSAGFAASASYQLASPAGPIVVQARPFASKTLGRVSGESPNTWYAGTGLRVSIFGLTVGADRQTTAKAWRPSTRATFGVAW